MSNRFTCCDIRAPRSCMSSAAHFRTNFVAMKRNLFILNSICKKWIFRHSLKSCQFPLARNFSASCHSTAGVRDICSSCSFFSLRQKHLKLIREISLTRFGFTANNFPCSSVGMAIYYQIALEKHQQCPSMFRANRLAIASERMQRIRIGAAERVFPRTCATSFELEILSDQCDLFHHLSDSHSSDVTTRIWKLQLKYVRQVIRPSDPLASQNLGIKVRLQLPYVL